MSTFETFVTTYLVPKVRSTVAIFKMANPESPEISVNNIINSVVNELIANYDPEFIKTCLNGDDDFFVGYSGNIAAKIYHAIVEDFVDGVGYPISDKFSDIFLELSEDDLDRTEFFILR